MAKQTRLTLEQVDKFYNEYVTQKDKKFAGDILDKKIWKSELELYLNQESANIAGWTNTEIRKANRLLLRQGSWSNKQEKILLKNFSKDAEAVSGLAAEYNIRETDVPNFIKNNQGHVYAFLKSYSSNWNEYFNS